MIPLGLVNSGSGLLRRRVVFLTGSDVSVSVGGCEGAEVSVERMEAADGLGTGCLGGAIIGGATRLVNEEESLSVTDTWWQNNRHSLHSLPTFLTVFQCTHT